MDRKELMEDVVHGTVKFPLAVYRQEKDEPFAVKLHWHEETEIICLESGRFTVEINMKKYRMNGPALFFAGAGDIHALRGEPGCRESAVVFDMKMLSFEYFDGVQSRLIRPLLDRTAQLPLLITCEDKIWEETWRLYQDILKESGKHSPASLVRVKASLYGMLACFYENGYLINMENTGDFDSEKIRNIKKVLGYIHEGYRKKLSIKELAGLLQMNEQYFCRYFKKAVGRTPTEYINEVRIGKAAGELERTGRKIIDIAMDCGYDNIGYFIKRFRGQKGMLPSEYRKKYQNSIINGQNG